MTWGKIAVFSYLSSFLDENKKVLSDNFYWYPDAKGNYSGLNNMQKADNLKVTARKTK
ncbi:hypothetical protein ACFFJX_29955 [Pseudarcicella hirudinis]|uniref:hypothetical protein n=1 Tax=Pseudarcicella hirudinis TaxID=1079859 RepID=UPI0035EDAD39